MYKLDSNINDKENKQTRRYKKAEYLKKKVKGEKIELKNDDIVSLSKAKTNLLQDTHGVKPENGLPNTYAQTPVSLLCAVSLKYHLHNLYRGVPWSPSQHLSDFEHQGKRLQHHWKR